MPTVLSRESTILTATFFALCGSGILTGGMLSLSFFTTPTLLRAPSPVAHKQWSYLYNRGKKTMPFLSLFTSLSYLLLSRLYTPTSISTTPIVPLSRHKPFLYLLSSGLTLSMVPYTMIFMRKNIAGLDKAGQVFKLGGAAERAGAEEVENIKVVEGKTVKMLIDEWGVWNLGRVALTGMGWVVGLWGSLVPVREVLVVVEAVSLR